MLAQTVRLSVLQPQFESSDEAYRIDAPKLTAMFCSNTRSKSVAKEKTPAMQLRAGCTAGLSETDVRLLVLFSDNVISFLFPGLVLTDRAARCWSLLRGRCWFEIVKGLSLSESGAS